MKWFLSVLTCLVSFAVAEPSSDQINEQIVAIEVPEPTMRDPVSVVTAVIPATAKAGESVTVVVKARILNGWRIYRYVPPTAAYMATKWVLELPEGVEKEGDWQMPTPEYLPGESNILIYQGEVVFKHNVKVTEEGSGNEPKIIKAGLNYQTCNNDMCLRPTKKVTEVAIEIR